MRGKGAGKSTVLSSKLKYSTCTCIVHALKGKFEAWESACVGACRHLSVHEWSNLAKKIKFLILRLPIFVKVFTLNEFFLKNCLSNF